MVLLVPAGVRHRLPLAASRGIPHDGGHFIEKGHVCACMCNMRQKDVGDIGAGKIDVYMCKLQKGRLCGSDLQIAEGESDSQTVSVKQYDALKDIQRIEAESGRLRCH